MKRFGDSLSLKDIVGILKKVILIVILALIVVVFLGLAWVSHWSDSELWALGLARDFFSSAHPSTDYKVLFNALLNLSYQFPFDNRFTVIAGRLLFAALGLAVASLLCLFAFLVSGRLKSGVWTGFLFITSALFLSQGFKMRSDMLACFFQLVALCHYLWFRKRALSRTHIIFNIFLNCLVLLATPKGIFHLLVNGVFIWSRERQIGQHTDVEQSFVRRSLVIAMGFVAAILIWKWEQIQTAWVFFLGSYAENEHHPGYFSLESFKYIGEALRWQWALVLLALGTVIAKVRVDSSRVFHGLGGAALTSLILICIHNDRLPFFILSLLPMPIAFLGVTSSEVFHSLSARFSNLAKIGRHIFIGVLCAQAFFTIHSIFKNSNNSVQVQLQDQMQFYLRSYPGSKYYDGTAVLPRDNTVFVFPAPMHAGNREEVLAVLDRPDLSLVFFGNRLFYYLNEFYLKLEEKYFIQIGKGVFARSYVVRSGHRMTLDEWKNVCQVLSADQVYAYEGANFLNMNRVGKRTPWSCRDPAPQLESQAAFTAFSVFDPFIIEDEKSFAEIFDASL